MEFRPSNAMVSSADKLVNENTEIDKTVTKNGDDSDCGENEREGEEVHVEVMKEEAYGTLGHLRTRQGLDGGWGWMVVMAACVVHIIMGANHKGKL